MQYRKMAKTGDSLSVLGYGTMRLPQKGSSIDEEKATRQLRYAIDRGVNYIDTAMPYHMGAAEPFLGKALADGYREKVKLATKMPPWYVKKPDDMDKLLSVQLDNLKTDHIDYYLLHNLREGTWQRLKGLGVVEFLKKAKDDGRIINVGFSFHGSTEELKRIVDDHDWAFCQVQYNILDEKNQAGIEGLKYAASKGMGIIIMEPLRGGNLTRNIPLEVKAIWNEAPMMRTPAEWALRFIWDHPEVTVVLSGMNDDEHIKENIRIADEALPGSLTDDEVKAIDRVREAYQRAMKVGCTGCRYCMPCPAGVDIPACFEAYNSSYLSGDMRNGKLFYLINVGGIMGQRNPGFASLCKECGKCVKACPQGINIPARLKDVKKGFETPDSKVLAFAAKQFLRLDGWRTKRKAGKIKK